MIADLGPYPAYKDSGVPWLGQVPQHWEVKRIKYLARLESGESITSLDISDTGPYAVYGGNGVRGFTSAYTNEGEFVLIGRQGALCGNINYAKGQFWASEHAVVAHPRQSFSLVWFGETLRTMNLNQYSISAAQPGLAVERIRDLRLPVPRVDEQVRISQFLDHFDRRIRRYVRAKQKLIALLNEQKQAIIHRAVTRGLDPNVRLKPSGVEWLGEVPEHWEVVSLRYLATKFGSGVTPRGGATIYQETGVPFLRSQNIHFDGLRLRGVARIEPDLHASLSATHVHAGDVLLNITGASIGRVCSVPGDFTDGNVNQHVCIIRPRGQRLLAAFLAAFLSTPSMQREIRFEQNGASREGLTLASIRGFKVLLPSLAEQERIVAAIAEQARPIVAASQQAEREIKLMREYRTRLIADVVTGKVDVRHLAPPAGEEPTEELEPLEEEALEDDAQTLESEPDEEVQDEQP